MITPLNMPAGEAIVGNLSTVTLVHRSSHQLTWSEAAANTGIDPDLNADWVDLYRTNQVRFRDEIRVGLEISSLKTYRVASLTA